MSRKPPEANPAAVAAYIKAAPEPARSRLRTLAGAIRKEAPGAVERIAYGLATWHQGENLVHLGAFKNHVGIYPGAAAMVAFAGELGAFKTSRGAIQVPHDAPLPTQLVRRITRWRLEQVSAPTTEKADITAYNAAQSPSHRAMCEALARHITAALPEAEGKVWHRHPVWFLGGNPVAGYSVTKGFTCLLFWSGQSFDEPGLTPVGKFKAAEARFANVSDIHAKDTRRWLKKAREIQWDYKNVAKRKGVLVRLER